MTEHYIVRALAASISTFADLSFEGWKDRVRYHHISWGLSDGALHLGYVLWLRRQREERAARSSTC